VTYKTETIVRLKIRSMDHTPEDITALLKLEPSKVWRIGEARVPGLAIMEKQNIWLLDSGLTRAHDLDGHLHALLDRISSCHAELTELSKCNSVEVSAVLYTNERPAIYFDPSMIGTFGAIGASLDIDLYILPIDEESSDKDDAY